MNLADQLEESIVDQIYENIIKPRVTACNDDKRGIPRRRGQLADSTVVYVGRQSDADTVVVIIQSDPPQTARYNTYKKDFGAVDYANFTNARGRTAGWFDAYARRVASKIAEG